MKFTITWLLDYLDLSQTLLNLPLTERVTHIEQILNAIGLEVDGVDDKYTIYSQFIIAKIEKTDRHPNSDKLTLCSVFDGNEIHQIVCGASNAKAGINVVLAPVGACIPSNNMIIQTTSIRGIDSSGMLCSAEELALLPLFNTFNTNNTTGIIELPIDAPLGITLAEYMGFSVVFDVSITPNRRQDAAYVIGVARDLSAVNKVGTFTDQLARFANINIPQQLSTYQSGANVEKFTSVTIIDKANCTSFLAFRVSGINQNIASSISNKIMNHINVNLFLTGHLHDLALVNISNFIMFTTGRPNHFYDADKIVGNIVVRQSVADEKFIALGGNEYILPIGILVIADDEKIISIAGVMGGELSKVDKNTRNIFVEIANFTPHCVIVSSRALGINSESQYRFEGKIDCGNTKACAAYAYDIITHCCGGYASNFIYQYGNEMSYIKTIAYDINILEKIIGTKIDTTVVHDILIALGYKINETEDDKIWIITIPTWRLGDVSGEKDLIEEIVRIYGIDKLDTKQEVVNVECLLEKYNNDNDDHRDIRYYTNCMRDVLTKRNMCEMISWSFFSHDTINHFMLDQYTSNMLEISNPISQDLTVMRNTILPNLVQNLCQNYVKGMRNISMFEIGNTFVLKKNVVNDDNNINNNCCRHHDDNDSYIRNYSNESDHSQLTQIKLNEISQTMTISGVRTGMAIPHNVHKEERTWDVYDVRDDVIAILISLGLSDNINNYKFIKSNQPFFHPGRCISIYLSDIKLADVGELHPNIAKTMCEDVATRIVMFEVYQTAIDMAASICEKSRISAMTQHYTPRYSEQQRLSRDLAFVVDDSVMACSIISSMRSAADSMIEQQLSIRNIQIFDVYSGENLPKNKKSVGVRFAIQPTKKTPTDSEINYVMQTLAAAVTNAIGGELRDASYTTG